MHCTNNQFPVSFASLALWWIASAVVVYCVVQTAAIFGDRAFGSVLIFMMVFFAVQCTVGGVILHFTLRRSWRK